MKWIGLTGGIATGKSSVAKIIRDLGLPVIDADSLAREVVQVGSPGLSAVVTAFGREILTPDGSLDRLKLGRVVFADALKREQLEKILHPLIQEKKIYERRRLENEGVELAFYDVPLLFEKNLQSDFEKIVLVYCSREEQIQRVMQRDGLTALQAEERLASQLPIDEKLKRADYVINNRAGISELRERTEAVVRELQRD